MVYRVGNSKQKHDLKQVVFLFNLDLFHVGEELASRAHNVRLSFVDQEIAEILRVEVVPVDLVEYLLIEVIGHDDVVRLIPVFVRRVAVVPDEGVVDRQT